MKRFVSHIIVLLLILIIAIPGPIHASTTESDEIDYSQLFSRAHTLCSSSQGDFIEELRSTYAAHPISFLDSLACEDSSTILAVVFQWLSDMPLDEMYSLRNTILQYTEYNEYSVIISNIDQQIGVREFALALEPYLDSAPTDDFSFSVPILRCLIDLNIENGNLEIDEDLHHLLSTAYDANPSLFAEMLNEYPQTQINALARCVASDYAKVGKAPPSITYSSEPASTRAIIDLIQNEISYSLNTKLSTESITLLPPSAELLASCVPTIGTMTYTTAPLNIGQTETLTVKFTETTQTATIRHWYVEIYQVVGSTRILKTAKSISMPAGSTETTASFQLTFSSASTFYTEVCVYSYKDGPLLSSRTGRYSDTVSLYWYITVVFPSANDRTQPGTLCLYNGSGTLHFQTSCLGLSVSNDDPMIYRGNTPTGVYTGYLGEVQTDTAAYGPYRVIKMAGISGEIIDSNRSGIWIHGGRSQTTLQATHGCVRVFNSAQLSLQNAITYLDSACAHETTGFIYISDAGA